MPDTVVRPKSARPRLQVRDLATIGIFSAILVVFTALAGLMTGFTPITFLLAPAVFALLSGPVFMLVAVRVRAPGAILLTSLVIGLVWSLTGTFSYLIGFAVFGLLAELVASATGYRSRRWLTVAYLLFVTAYYMSAFGTIFFFVDYYLRIGTEVAQLPLEFVEGIVAVVRSWLAPVAYLVTIASALVSAWLGNRILRKHFEKAGIV